MDMIVNLYELDKQIEENGFEVRRILSPNIHLLQKFIVENFDEGWASEASAACYKSNPTCFIAVQEQKIIGFACFGATTKGFFGPLGVASQYRKNGVAKALVLKTLYAMKEDGYAYGIIGGVSEKLYGFYNKICGAKEIESTKQVYSRMI